MDLIWLIPLLPGLGAAVNGLFGIRWFSKRTAGVVACTTMAAAFGLSAVAFVQLLGLEAEARVHDVVLFDWIPATALAMKGNAIGALHIPWAFRLDPLSAMMILVVTGIGFLIHVYSTAYMHDEPRGGVARYFSYLNLFCFFMLTLVLGGNYLVMFVGWEGVGLCSYLLIGYWYEKKSASDAGKKAFITNRVGDWGFLLGVFLIYFTFGSFDFREVANAASALPIETAQFGTLSVITLLLFVGACGKSAQIPLYVWLPDAMEGPTPVSALIHAATMVTAGVYMVGRNAVLFSHAPMTMEIVAIVGVLTAVMAASIGLVQTDIKRVLAYSTVSQLGYMFVAMGVGAFAAGAFHLMTHAFFKALLFLCSGAVIHAMAGEQNMLKMGGLRKHMPVTFWTMMIGTVAIAGIPPFAGFFSKDEILLQAFLQNKLVYGLAAFAALMTAFYMFRLMSLTFFGEYRGPAWETAGHGQGAPVAPASVSADRAPGAPVAPASVPADHGHGGHGAWHGPHEAPKPMTFALVVLAVGAVLAGFVGVPAALGGGNAIEHFLHPSFAAPSLATHSAAATAGKPPEQAAEPAGSQEASASAAHEASAAGPGEHTPAAALSHAGELVLMGFSVLIGVIGIATAYRFYVRRPQIAATLKARLAGPHRVLTNKYYVDELYGATVIRGTVASANGLWTFDRKVVDGAVNGSGALTRVTSWLSGLLDKYIVDGLVNLVGSILQESSFIFRRLQTGLIQNYALLMLFGVFAFVSLYLVLGR
jgi:NADH-quinone oxidoreductase subunit L